MKLEKDPFDDPFFTNTENYMKKLKIKHGIYLLITIVSTMLLFIFINKDLSNKQKITKRYIGKKIIIEKRYASYNRL